MMHSSKKWEISELSQAMARAIFQKAHSRFIRQDGDTVKFNGFWRDGDKQNICVWLSKASWHDAKTGEGGGCKEFAKIAFNMTLPEFMKHYGDIKPKDGAVSYHKFSPEEPQTKSANALAVGYVDEIWQELSKRDLKRSDQAALWLEQERAIINPRSYLRSGFANLFPEDIELFDKSHHSFIKQRLLLGPHILAPMRSMDSAQVENFFFRAMLPISKDQKSRLLSGVGGLSNSSGKMRAFGFPHLISDFNKVVMVEGMADYFSAEYLLDADEKILPIGAPNADSLIKWAQEFVRIDYHGQVVIIYHIDANKKDELSTKEIGPAKAIQAAQVLQKHHIPVQIFPWPYYLKNSTAKSHKVRDLADSVKQQFIDKECSVEHLKETFYLSLSNQGAL